LNRSVAVIVAWAAESEHSVAKALRVHHLAKELGVKSKEIIAKCAAEGIELKNHMSTVALGLGESIREWFSSTADVTSIEEAAPVDLEKIRIKVPEAPAKVEVAADAGDADDEAGDVAVAVAVADDQSGGVASDDAALSPTEGDESITEVALAAEPVAPEIAAPPAEDADVEVADEAAVAADEPLAPAAEHVEAQPAEPVEPPEPPKPAGPQVVPAPAELKGPRVVRIEAPDPVRMPRPRPAAQHSGPSVRPGPFSPPTEPAAPARGRGRGRKGESSAAPARGRSPRRHGGSTDIVEREKEWREQDLAERRERLASATGHGLRARKSAERRRQTSPGAAPTGRKTEVAITAPIAIKDFCAAIGAPFRLIAGRLQEHVGRLFRINETLDAETAELVALDLGVTLKIKRARTALEKLTDEFAALPREHLAPRPPVVAMLGHVDHGKTSLLDAIRKTHVADGEAGGITQHIGAYRIDHGAWNVTFLDTPGHEAFTEMRSRGAHLTDVVVLVIAADDGVMPQTIEAIKHAKAAGVDIVVALNKVDLPGVNLDRIYAQLAEQDLTPAEWGGKTDIIKTSAKTGAGVDELLAHLSTLSELLELQADATLPAQGTVIEARKHEGRGIIAHVLVREGTLKPGQVVVCGPGAGRVRSLIDDRGKRLKHADPGTPVEVVGLDDLPTTGDGLYVVPKLPRAKAIAEEAREQRRVASLHALRPKAKSIEELLKGAEESEIPELNLIVRADNQGSLEALCGKLSNFPSDKARLKILLAGVGTVTEADVRLATTGSGAVVIGFHVVPEDHARRLAEQSGVDVRVYRVIYEVIDDVYKALEGLLDPIEHEEPRGKAEVRQVFNVSRLGTIAGCLVTDGLVHRAHRVRLLRDGRIVLENAAIHSLKRFKDDAREVKNGFECGIKIQGYDDVKPGDVIEAFEIVEVAQRL